MHLKLSKGCWQLAQKWSALQAVDPKRERNAVSFEPQNGQATFISGVSKGERVAAQVAFGGAMP